MHDHFLSDPVCRKLDATDSVGRIDLSVTAARKLRLLSALLAFLNCALDAVLSKSRTRPLLQQPEDVVFLMIENGGQLNQVDGT